MLSSGPKPSWEWHHNKGILAGGLSRWASVIPQSIRWFGVRSGFGGSSSCPWVCPGIQRAAHTATAFWQVRTPVLVFSFPLLFTSYFPAFKAPQPPPSNYGTLMHRAASPILEGEISSLWHTVLDELIPSWSMLAGCAWVFLWAGGKGNWTGGANKGGRACLQQEALRRGIWGMKSCWLAVAHVNLWQFCVYRSCILFLFISRSSELCTLHGKGSSKVDTLSEIDALL